MNYLLSVNGYDSAIAPAFGCGCDRCQEPKRVANTSLSIIGLDENRQTQVHVVIDVGHGITQSLYDSPYLKGENARLDGIMMTHWHPDHSNELILLIQGWQIANEDYSPISLWGRYGTVEWLKRQSGRIWSRLFDPHSTEENLPPGRVLPAFNLPFPDIQVTPITVSHYSADIHPENFKEQLGCCVAYVIETASKKAVLLWDIDSSNHWLGSPGADEMPAIELMRDADYLFVDTTTWDALKHQQRERHTHASFQQIQTYVNILWPRQTILVHLGGHADRPGNPGYGWPDSRWQVETEKVWREKSLPGSIVIPEIGMTFEL